MTDLPNWQGDGGGATEGEITALATRVTSLEAAQSGSVADGLRLTGIPRFMNLATRCNPNTQPGGVDGSTTGDLLVWSHFVIEDGDNWRIGYANTYGGGRVAATNAIVLQAALEDHQGYPHQVTFYGQLEVTIPPEGIAISDPIPLLLRGGLRVRSRTWVKVLNADDLIPSGDTFSDHWEEGRIAGTDATPLTTDTVTLNTDTPAGAYFAPCLLGADFAATDVCVAVYGDSITAGQGDANTNHDEGGWALRALASQVPYVMLAIPGDSAYGFSAPPVGAPNGLNDRRQRMQITSGCTHALGMYASNDLTTDGITAEPVQRSLLRTWRAFKLRGMYVTGATITPLTSSTDGFTTLENQTPDDSTPVRIEINDWIRDGAPCSLDSNGEDAPAAEGSHAAGVVRFGETGHPADDYVELADAVESSRNSGLWAITEDGDGSLTDGIHPNPFGHPLMAQAVDLSLYGGTPPAPSAPANTVAPAITPTSGVEAGDTLTCSAGTWTGYPSPSFTRQWKRDGANIVGQTGATYVTVDPTDVDADITCTVTATNTQGSASAGSNTVTPAAPSSGFDPASLANKDYWLKPESLGASGTQQTWADSFGNSHSPTQATAGQRPTILSNAINGLKGLTFDGVDDELVWEGNPLADSPIPVTRYLLARWTAAGDSTMMDGSVGGLLLRLFRDTTNIALDSAAGTPFGALSGSTSYHVITIQATGATTKLWVDGVLKGSPTGSGLSGFVGGLMLGRSIGGQHGPVEIVEAIGYTAAHDDATRGQVEGYLATRGGI